MASREERIAAVEKRMKYIRVKGSTQSFVLRLIVVLAMALSFGISMFLYLESREAQGPPVLVQSEQAQQMIRDEYATYQTDLQNILTVAIVVFTLFTIGIPIMQYGYIQKERVEELEKMMLMVDEAKEAVVAATEEAAAAMNMAEKMLEDASKQMELLNQQMQAQHDDYDKLKVHHAELLDKVQEDDRRAQELQTNLEELRGLTGQHEQGIAEVREMLSRMESAKPQAAKGGGSEENSKHFEAGFKANNEGRYQDAIDAYTKAIGGYKDADDKANQAIACNNRGIAYRRLNQHDKAIADYTEAIRLDPKYAKAHNNWGYAYFLLNQYDNAFEHFSEAIRLDPKFIIAYQNRALCYDKMGEPEKAAADRATVDRLKQEQETAP